MHYKALFFDFWGTLVEVGVFPSPLRQIKRILWLHDTDFSDYVVRLEKVFMTEPFDNLADAFTAVCKEFGVQAHPKKIDILIGLWNKNRLLAKPFAETIDALKKLKKKYKLVLISNTDNFSIAEVMEKFKMKDLFDELVFSYEHGKLKSDPELYQVALDKLGIKAEEALMVGDSIESDMEGGQRAGLGTVLIDRKGRREFEPKIANLTELEEFLNTEE